MRYTVVPSANVAVGPGSRVYLKTTPWSWTSSLTEISGPDSFGEIRHRRSPRKGTLQITAGDTVVIPAAVTKRFGATLKVRCFSSSVKLS